MARGPREVSNTGLYHVTLKGINGMQLFSEANDFEHFLGLLKNALDKTGVTLLAWCLMSNHVHLAVLDPNQMLSKMVQVRHILQPQTCAIWAALQQQVLE